jgi:cysteine synthase A
MEILMSDPSRDILERIGNTSLLPLRRIRPANGARILLKLESENPTGSMKDRMALAMIEAAEADGRLGSGGTVVEYTGGSTGVSLSLVCAVKGYPLHIVTSDAFAPEKLDHMAILGARLRIVPSDAGKMTEKLTRDMVEAARVIAAETGGFWTDQLNNEDQLAAYHKLAEEIWRQSAGRIDGFVQAVGTAASLRGTAEALRRHDGRIRIIAVEPPNPRCSRAADRAAIRSTGSARASWCRSGGPASPITSNGYRRRKPPPWRSASRGRKGSSPAPPPAPMSSRHCAWLSSWRRRRPSSRSCATPA